jgi:hypothetical protein
VNEREDEKEGAKNHVGNGTAAVYRSLVKLLGDRSSRDTA